MTLYIFIYLAMNYALLSCADGYGQPCQQSLPSQYNPSSDSSTATSNLSTFYLYPDFFNTTRCLGPIMNIQYQFCYLFAKAQGSPDVFTVFILSDEGSEYRVLHSFTKREDGNCDVVCCTTESIDVILNVQRELALGFVIPSNTRGNALYESDTTMSPGFAVASTITATDSTINKASFLGVRQQIRNRRFSVSFAIESSSLATTTTVSEIG